MPTRYAFLAQLALETSFRWGELAGVRGSDLEMARRERRDERRSRRASQEVVEDEAGPASVGLFDELGTRVGRSPPTIGPLDFARMVRRFSGVEWFLAHQLRHTFACLWLEIGGDVAALRQIFGHASIVATQRYAKLNDDMAQREVRDWRQR